MIIPNFLRDCTAAGFMELVMNWPLVYRDEGDMKAMIDAAVPTDHVAVSMWRDPSDQVIVAEVQRLG